MNLLHVPVFHHFCIVCFVYKHDFAFLHSADVKINVTSVDVSYLTVNDKKQFEINLLFMVSPTNRTNFVPLHVVS